MARKLFILPTGEYVFCDGELSKAREATEQETIDWSAGFQLEKDTVIAGDTQTQALKTHPEFISLMTYLRNATPAQLQNYINTEVTDLASARFVLLRIAVVLAALVRKIYYSQD